MSVSFINADIGPDVLVFIIVNPAYEVKDDMRLIGGGKSISMITHAGGGRQLGKDIVIFQLYFIVVRFGDFGA